MKSLKSFKVGRDGAILGVFDEPEMVYMISCGKVLGSDDYWTEGMSTWAKVSSREIWTVASADPASSAVLPPPINSTSSSDWEVKREELVELEMNRRRKLRESTLGRTEGKESLREPNETVNRVSFFAIWWKTTLVIYAGSACLGYLNSGGYGLGQMLGQGLVTAPLSALLFGGIIYAFSKK